MYVLIHYYVTVKLSVFMYFCLELNVVYVYFLSCFKESVSYSPQTNSMVCRTYVLIRAPKYHEPRPTAFPFVDDRLVSGRDHPVFSLVPTLVPPIHRGSFVAELHWQCTWACSKSTDPHRRRAW